MIHKDETILCNILLKKHRNGQVINGPSKSHHYLEDKKYDVNITNDFNLPIVEPWE